MFFHEHCHPVTIHSCTSVSDQGWAAAHQLSARPGSNEVPGELLYSSYINFLLSSNGWGDRVTPILITRKQHFLPSEICLLHWEEMLLFQQFTFIKYQTIMLSL